MINLNMRQREKWTYKEIYTLNILSQYKVPQRVIGKILLRSRKAIERKKRHLKEMNIRYDYT